MSIDDVTVHVPAGMFGASGHDSALDSVLREIAVAAAKPEEWAEKYGTTVDNDVFSMHPYCWCEEEDCKWCGGSAPNFVFKPTGFEVWWYKYIGRSTETNRTPGRKELQRIRAECLATLAQEPTHADGE